MNFDQLTPEQQAAYLNFMLLIRPMVGKIANVAVWIDQLTTSWTTEIQPIHNQLAANAVIPDNTGYPNAMPLNKVDVTNALGLLAAVFTLYTPTIKQVAVKSVGPENVLDSD